MNRPSRYLSRPPNRGASVSGALSICAKNDRNDPPATYNDAFANNVPNGTNDWG